MAKDTDGTARAGGRFMKSDWQGMRSDRTERLDLYKTIVDYLETDIRDLLGEGSENKSIWVQIKAIYAEMIDLRPDRELAETFFNSVTRRVFVTIGVDPGVEFVASRHECVIGGPDSGVYKDYGRFTSGASMVKAVLSDTPMNNRMADLEAGGSLLADVLPGQAVVRAGGLEAWEERTGDKPTVAMSEHRQGVRALLEDPRVQVELEQIATVARVSLPPVNDVLEVLLHESKDPTQGELEQVRVVHKPFGL